ncbi:hypothetical protein N9D90_00315 [Alphaproteobacteria bacterium]|nr:hypothetical protein [Alphaproteobacteria bacterium]
MNKTLSSSLDLIWDLTRERLTIGGALVLRQEGEILAQIRGQKWITLHINCRGSDRSMVEGLSETVFGSSTLPFKILYSHSGVEGWPPQAVRSHPNFSYYSFSRLISMHKDSGIKPCLRWGADQKALAKQVLAQTKGLLICVHLRSVAPFTVEESNADGPSWQTFFDKHAIPGVCNFVLVGDDALPEGLNLPPGVHRAVDSGIDLATQLALVSCANGFLGMASGICTAANLSEVPYVIFKHPGHHSAEMLIELGAATQFPFSGSRQQLWRCEVDAVSLTKAFNFILS